MPVHESEKKPSPVVLIILSAALSLSTIIATAAFTFAWKASSDLAVLKSQQTVSREEFAMVKAQVSANEKEIERLRTWMIARAVSGGNRSTTNELPPPAPAEAAPH
jgi:hypothetical protein